MWIERRMTDGPRQTKADAASCPLETIGEDRPGPQMCATVVTTGGRAGRRLHRTPPGHHLHSGVDVIHHPNLRESRPGTTSRQRAALERTETGRAAPNESGTRPTFRIVEEHSSRRPILWSGFRPRTGGGTPRAIARIEVRAIGSAMWLERCCCRRRPQGIPTPALV